MTPPSHPADDWEASPADRDVLAPARGLGLEGLLAMLERLDGGEEAAVARSALAAGMPPMVVTDELQREVERRLLRLYPHGE